MVQYNVFETGARVHENVLWTHKQSECVYNLLFMVGDTDFPVLAAI